MNTNVEYAKACIAQSDALLLGISNGLSIAEGYNIFADNAMFQKQFGEFRHTLNIHCVLDGCFYPDPVQRKAFLESLVRHWVHAYEPSPVMRTLLRLVGEKDYFVITSNGDTHLELAGFDPERVFEIEGTFVGMLNDAPIVDKTANFSAFIEKYQDAHLTMLELGIGKNNLLIKQPMMHLCAQLPNASYLVFNLEQEIFIPASIASKAVSLPGDLAITLQALVQG